MNATKKEHPGPWRLQSFLRMLCKRRHLVLTDRYDVYLPARDAVLLYQNTFECVAMYKDPVREGPRYEQGESVEQGADIQEVVFAGVRFDVVECRHQRISPEHRDERAEHWVIHLKVNDIWPEVIDHGDDVPYHRVARRSQPPGMSGVVEGADLDPRTDILQVLL